ncbi:MAG: M6 family metalloprotease domain-containing protein [Prevotella sp.]|nr:M6 family metalloprotease domain-containing protein [Prevotella sp.]
MKRVKVRLLVLTAALCLSAVLYAVPVKPGMWQYVRLADGRRVLVEPRGDEREILYFDREGNVYVEAGKDVFRQTTLEEVQADTTRAAYVEAQIEQALQAKGAQKARRKAGYKDTSYFQGSKKGIVILAEFTDVKFHDYYQESKYGVSSVNGLYKRIVNEVGFNVEPFVGSVRDYFRDQSIDRNGNYQFDIDFDVVGPVALSQKRDYYGAPILRKDGTTFYRDSHVGYMIYEAVQLADKQGVDFSKYDWDGDGEVDEVFVIWAGQGEADQGGANTPYAVKSTLSARYTTDAKYASNANYYGYTTNGNAYTTPTYGALTLDGVKIDVFACSPEQATDKTWDYDEFGMRQSTSTVTGTRIFGIGTLCHEFSHCLGYHDLYDSSNTRNSGMGAWDIMSYGSYNGDGYCPAGYTAYERWAVGWLDPIVLDEPTVVEGLTALGDGGEAYVVYCRGNDKTGEFYTLENRQQTGWDTYLPWSGLLISHIDYNQTIWDNNSIKINPLTADSNNDHARISMFRAGTDVAGLLHWDAYPYEPDYFLPQKYADNATLAGKTGSEIASYLNEYYSSKGTTLNLGTQLNNELSATSTPAAVYYNSTAQTGNTAKPFADHEIHHITRNADGTVNFIYRYPEAASLALHEGAQAGDIYSTGLYDEVTIDRTLSAGKWSTMWLPFDLNQTEVRQYFGTDAMVAQFAGVTTTSKSTTVNFRTNTADDGSARTTSTQAGVPFLVKVSHDTKVGPFSYKKVTRESTDEASVTIDGWTFAGTKTSGLLPEGAYFISGNKFYRSVGKSTSKAYRAYFVATEADSTEGVASGFSPTFLQDSDPEHVIFYDDVYGDMGVDLDDVETSIDGVTSKNQSEAVDRIYNIQGQQVGTTATSRSLPKGIYIRNGRKVIIK